MTSARRLIADLAHRGIRLERHGARVRYRAPAGALTPADRAAVAAHRNDVLDVLGFALVAEVFGQGTTPATLCPRCGRGVRPAARCRMCPGAAWWWRAE